MFNEIVLRELTLRRFASALAETPVLRTDSLDYEQRSLTRQRFSRALAVTTGLRPVALRCPQLSTRHAAQPMPLHRHVPKAMTDWLENMEDVDGGSDPSTTEAGDEFFRLKVKTDHAGLSDEARMFLGVTNEDVLHADWPEEVLGLATRVVDAHERVFVDEEVLGPDSKADRA